MACMGHGCSSLRVLNFAQGGSGWFLIALSLLGKCPQYLKNEVQNGFTAYLDVISKTCHGTETCC